MTKKKEIEIPEVEGLEYLGGGKSSPWNPYRAWTTKDPKINYWQCLHCNSILWSTSIIPPECNCKKRFKFKHPKLYKFLTEFKYRFRHIFEKIMMGGVMTWADFGPSEGVGPRPDLIKRLEEDK